MKQTSADVDFVLSSLQTFNTFLSNNKYFLFEET
jgi:hypothetical protein